MYTEWTPKWPSTLKDRIYPICMLYLHPNPKCHSVSLKSQRFRVIGHFKTSAPNDPQMTFDTKTWEVPHVHVTTTPESQISIHFAPRWVAFELQAILRQVYWMMTPWTLEGQRYPIYMLQLPPESQISLHFAIWLAILGLQAILRQVHWVTQKWPWALEGRRLSIYIWSILLYGELRAILRHVYRMTPWTPEGQRYPIYMLQLHVRGGPPESQISLHFAEWLAILELQAVLRLVHWMTSKWLWALEGQRLPIYMWQLPPPPSTKSQSLSL